jgi:hypothetical protein
MPKEEQPPFYEVRLPEPAEIEIEAEHERLSDLVSSAYADRWRDGLIAELARLSIFPTSHEVAPENDLYNVEIRRLLYHGPAKRRGGPSYRILFYIVAAYRR